MLCTSKQNESFLSKIKINENGLNELQSALKNKDMDSIYSVFSEHKDCLERKHTAVIFELGEKDDCRFSYQEIHALNPIIGSVFGELLPQNDKGETAISVYDRDRLGSMWKGARYHQTREGGSIHTDNVNVPEIWDYLYLSCLSPALVGGENILVDGNKIHELLKSNFPDALKVLEGDFVWEMRGVSDELYYAPIVTYGENAEVRYRHLRPYMESAHEKAERQFTAEQLYAVDILDALTNSSENQIRYRMKQGDILLTKDTQVLHGRTCFSDALNAVCYDEAVAGSARPLKRTMERLWIKK